jgi:hypothetical protein
VEKRRLFNNGKRPNPQRGTGTAVINGAVLEVMPKQEADQAKNSAWLEVNNE